MIKLKSLIKESTDYDPSWDYDIHHNPPYKLVNLVNSVINSKSTIELLKRLNINSPKIHYIRDNNKEALARYIAGTSNNPHIVIDLDTINASIKKHSGNMGFAIESTIIHELVHAYLESRGLDPSEHDEDVVEGAAREYMDFRDPLDLIQYIDTSYPNLDEI